MYFSIFLGNVIAGKKNHLFLKNLLLLLHQKNKSEVLRCWGSINAFPDSFVCESSGVIDINL